VRSRRCRSACILAASVSEKKAASRAAANMAAAIIASNMRAHAEREKEKEKAREKVVDAVFEKYDTDRSGSMEVDELTTVLTMMTGGAPPVCDATLFHGAGARKD
jgi:hypothetical protein